MYLLTAIGNDSNEEQLEISQKIFPDGETLTEVKEFAEKEYNTKDFILIIYHCPCSSYNKRNCIPVLYSLDKGWKEFSNDS
jgi:hypothetical protein